MDNKNNKNNRPSGLKVLIYYVALFAIIALVVHFVFGPAGDTTQQRVTLNFSQFVSKIESGNVKTITVISPDRSYTGVLKDGSTFIAYAPSEYDMAVISEKYIVPQAAEGKLEVVSVRPSNLWSWLSLIPTIIMIIAIITPIAIKYSTQKY